jgi:transposase InsO family protein
MSWEERTVEKQREAFVQEVKSGEKSKSAVCRAYGITRRTGDKWIKRYEAGERLTDRSRAPFRTPNKTGKEAEEQVLAIRAAHPVWGARKIQRVMEKAGEREIPATSTISDILKRNGYITHEASQAATPYKRFQKESSNEMWQTDFKGHFGMLDGKRCHPLTVLDDYSRYSLCVDAKENEQRAGVVESFTILFERYGLPDALLCDNGNPWGSSQSTGYTQFEIWLMDYGILPIHGRIRHPQTQGKAERFNKTMENELLRRVEIADIYDAQRHFNAFRDCYNNERPHEAINMNVPSDIYIPFKRKKPDYIREWAYPSGFTQRKVKSTGYVTYGNQGYFLSEAFGGLTVGIRESMLENCINLYYRQFRIGRIDLKERSFTSKRIYPAGSDSIGGEI